MRSSLGIACAMGLAACNGGGGAGNVRLGVLLSTSGENANGGSEALLGVLLAQEEINRAGGVFGESLELVHRDDASDEGTARARATELDASGPVALLGAMASGVTLAVSRVTSADRILQISGSSTSALLTTADDQDFLFRTCASDVLQSRLLARRALQKGFHAVSVIYRPGAYGQELAGAFAAAFTDGGGTLPISKQYSPGQPSYSALLGEVYGAGTPDAVVLIAYTTDAAQIIRDYNTGGFSAMQTFWFFTDAIEDQAFVDLTGASNFTFQNEGTGPAVPSTASYQAFAAAFQARWNQPLNAGNFTAQYYDAVYLVALAASAAGKSESAAVRDQLRAVASGGRRLGPGDYATAAAAAAAGEDLDFDGASGPLDFDAHGDVVAPYDIWKVQNGAIQIVERSVNP
jgi:branched-chain amino acid transport system substrate-binding protein